jgi:mediator of RNA polymerase II transcription subunit 6
MAAPQKAPPLDEIQFRGVIPEGGIHSNSVLWYFNDSPWYDRQSSNEIVKTQGMNNIDIFQDLGERVRFEGRVKTMTGTEFIVAQEPSEMAPGTGTGVWVINKQHRRKRQGQEDEVNVLGTYFLVNENIYMAPSVADVMSSRIVGVSQKLGLKSGFPASIRE